jgi:hypothetical protein
MRGGLASEARPPQFEYHANRWIALHHTLIEQTNALHAPQQPDLVRGLGAVVRADLARVRAADEPGWFEALKIYRLQFASKDLLFDADMIAIDMTLLRMDRKTSPVTLPLPAPMVRALLLAEPVYRRVFETRHEAANARWIADARRYVGEFGGPSSRALPKIFEIDWLRVPYRVDVMPYSDRFGAYSFYRPLDPVGRIFVSSMAPDATGAATLETVFHEASHSLVEPDDGPVGMAIRDAAKRLGRPAPPGLWHAVIFYTTGRLAETTLAKAGIRFTMSAETAASEYLFRRAWPTYVWPLQHYWEPYMNGRGTLRDALARVVEAIPG